MEMERSRFAGYRRIMARGRHITLTLRARLHLHQAHTFEDLEMLRSLRLPELEPDMDVVHRSRACAKQLNDPKSIGFA